MGFGFETINLIFIIALRFVTYIYVHLPVYTPLLEEMEEALINLFSPNGKFSPIVIDILWMKLVLVLGENYIRNWMGARIIYF